MLIIPAIDLQDGCVVRYVRGASNKKIYSKDPVKTARHWEKGGAKILHVVDLDGAFSGRMKNAGIVKEIAKSIDIPVQCGGGLRSIEAVKMLLNSGVWRVVLGTRAVSDAAFLKKVFTKFKNKVIVSVDARSQKVLTEGWRSRNKNTDLTAFAKNLQALGFRQIIYTDTLKDGTLSGPNIKQIKLLLKHTGLEIIASGGVSCLDDIFKLKKLGQQGVAGVIIGKALYEGRFTLGQALKFS